MQNTYPYPSRGLGKTTIDSISMYHPFTLSVRSSDDPSPLTKHLWLEWPDSICRTGFLCSALDTPYPRVISSDETWQAS